MRTFIRRFTITMLLLLLGLLLFHGVEDWRGRRAWETYLHDQESQGAIFDPARLAPPSIPAAENFAAVPLIAKAAAGKGWDGWPTPDAAQDFISQSGLASHWKEGKPIDLEQIRKAWGVQSLGTALNPYDPVLDTLAQAAKRPHSRLPVSYKDPDDIPTLLSFRSVFRVLAFRAIVRLHSNKPDLAFEDVLTGTRLIGHLKREPHLISQLLRITETNLLLQPIWEGLQSHSWNENQLAALGSELADIDLLASWKRGCQWERLYNVWAVRGIERAPLGAWIGSPVLFPFPQHSKVGHVLDTICLPKGWAYRNFMVRDQSFVADSMDPVDPAHHRVYPDVSRRAQESQARTRQTPYNFLGLGALRGLPPQTERVSRAQVGLDEARIAVALERFHLANGRYPERLGDLAPRFLDDLPPDLTTGESYHYRLQPNRTYLLYSVGWDQKDDGGTPSTAQSGSQGPSADRGDWPWSPLK